jgi:hypothetical protein
MSQQSNDLQAALTEVSASSAGGAPFLIAYGLTFAITGALSLWLERPIVALVAMFQGSAALPLALWLERRMGTTRMSASNPLRPLSGQLAMSQALAIPALIVVYTLNPGAIPVVLAGLGGTHFLPYAWLHRTRIYAGFAGVVALGAFGLQVWLGATAFNVILFFLAAVYWVTALLVYRHARQIVSASA